MTTWWTRLFRSRGEMLAERAEVEGRFDDAARLYVAGGAYGPAFRVLVRAAEASGSLSEKRKWLARAYATARTDELRRESRRALALVTLAETGGQPPRTPDERARLGEAAAGLESVGAHREAAQAYRLLGDREGIERALLHAGDIDGYEREASADQRQERLRLRRRTALGAFDGAWTSGDRVAALGALARWLDERADDHEVRRMHDEASAKLVTRGRMDVRIDGVAHAVVGRFPCTLGREGDVVVRGSGVSREHCRVEMADGRFVVRDEGSRNGTLVRGVHVAGSAPLAIADTLQLGPDLVFAVRNSDARCTDLETTRGMDAGRRLVFVASAWPTPVGIVTFGNGSASLEPVPDALLGTQRVAVPITLARGDRIAAAGVLFEVVA